MISKDQFFLSAQIVPAFFAYRELLQSRTLDPAVGAICTAVASGALAKLGEYLGASYISRLDSIKHYKVYVIPSIWLISSFLTTMSLFPLRFITVVAPALTLMGAVTLVALMALGVLYITKREPSPHTSTPNNLSNTPEETVLPEASETLLDTSLVITTANRVLADIQALNKERGVTEFSYSIDRDMSKKDVHSVIMNDRLKRDKDAALAALQQKIELHIKGMGVTLAPPKYENLGLRTISDLTRTFYIYSQDLLNSHTKQVIARAIIYINHTDKSVLPSFMGVTVKGKLISEIVMDPFQVVP